MCETGDNRQTLLHFKPAQKPPLLTYRSKNRLFKLLATVIHITGKKILSFIIYFLECLLFIFKIMSKKCELKVQTKDKEIQTNYTFQDIHMTELLSHHFGLIHEKYHINRIIHKNQWNNLMVDINFIKDQLKTRNSICQEDVLSTMTLLKKEVDSLKHMIHKISLSIDRISACSPTTSTSNIPLPPPLPPFGYISLNTVLGQTSRTSMNGRPKSLFGEMLPPRPIITVESLRQVKLKKTPVISKTEKTSKEEVHNVQKIKLSKSNSSRKRPRTADNSKIMLKDESPSSSPRPLTSHT